MATFWFVCFAFAVFYGLIQSEAFRKWNAMPTWFSAIHQNELQDLVIAQMRDQRNRKTEEDRKTLTQLIEEIAALLLNEVWSDELVVDQTHSESHQKAIIEMAINTCRASGIVIDSDQERSIYGRIEQEWEKKISALKALKELELMRERVREEQRIEKERAELLMFLESKKIELERLHQEQLERLRIIAEMEAAKKTIEEEKLELEAAITENLAAISLLTGGTQNPIPEREDNIKIGA